MKRYKSCFVVDVMIDKEEIMLSDSAGHRYFINRANSECMKQFQYWFKNVFSKGIAQTLTIFKYQAIEIGECDMKLNIVKFLNVDIESN